MHRNQLNNIIMKDLFFTSELEASKAVCELVYSHAKFRVVGRKHIVVY